MAFPPVSFSTLPSETLDEIAGHLASRDALDLSPDSIAAPYRNLCSLRLVSRRCNDAASPLLFQSVALNRSFLPWRTNTNDTTVRDFASLRQARPHLLASVEILQTNFSSSYGVGSIESERILFPALTSMERLRVVEFEPYVSGDAFVDALHPASRVEVVGTLCFGGSCLQLNGQELGKLVDLSISLDGHGHRSHGPNFDNHSLELRLPSSLRRLHLSSDLGLPFVLSLATSIQELKFVDIRGRRLEAVQFTPFFETQGAFITSLRLIGRDAMCELEEDEEGWRTPPDWRNPVAREAIHNRFNLLPVLSLCPNLTLLRINDVNLPLLARLGHPSLKVIVLRREGCVDFLRSAGFEFDDIPGNSFEKVALAIRDIQKSEFPELRRIRYLCSSWETVLFEQEQVDEGPWGLEDVLESKGLKLFDGVGQRWKDELWDRFSGRERWWDDEEEEEEEEEAEDGEDEGGGEEDEGEGLEDEEDRVEIEGEAEVEEGQQEGEE